MRSDSVLSLDDLDVIVDVDSHVTETVDVLLPYIDDDHQGIKRILADAAHPIHDIYSVTHAMPPWSSVLGSDTDTYSSDNAADLSTKIEHMEDFGIDYSFLNPTLNLAINTIDNPRFAVPIARAYNEWIRDTFLSKSNRFVTGVLVAPQKPQRAVKEIKRIANEPDIVAVLMPNTGLVPPAGHNRYDPIYEAAEEHGLPIVMHSASGGSLMDFPTIRTWNETYAEDHMIAFSFLNMWHLTSIMFNGVPERFPDLNFVFQESGIAWVPYWKWRLDDNYLEIPDEVPHLNKLPSEYVDNQCYFSTQPLGHTAKNPKHMAMAIEMAGPESILYSSDLPHVDFDPPEELFERVYTRFDNDTVRGMMGETAAELFDLPS